MSLFIDFVYSNTGGWGPPCEIQENLFPEFMRNLPYPIVYKADRSNRMADLAQVTMRNADAEEELEFHLVEGRTRKTLMKTHGNRLVNRFNYYGNQRMRYYSRGYLPTRGPYNRNRGYRRRYFDNRKSDVSMNINPEWGDPVAIFDFLQMSKCKPSDKSSGFLAQGTSSDEYTGQISIFNWDKKRINLRNPVPLKRTEKQFQNYPIAQDKTLLSHVSNGSVNVVMSDAVMSTLMAVVRSVYSWDLEVNKQDGVVWFDKRPNSRFDWISVNENAADYVDITEDAMNSINSLCNEALYVQKCYLQQVVDNVVKKYDVPKPFVSESNVASVGHCYRILPLESNNINVGVRCDIDSLKNSEGGYARIMIRTLNEYDVRITGDWRKTLETQRGGVLATELKNNMFKVQRWIIQAKLADCKSIVIGFVTRQSFKDNLNHLILAVEEYPVDELIEQLNINLDQMWAVFTHIIEQVVAQPDGKYVLFKEPLSSSLKLYNISTNS